MIVVAKIGTSSITDDHGEIREDAVTAFCQEVAAARAAGHTVVAVTSGAIAAGLPALGLGGPGRPRDVHTLQAASAVGQSRIMQVYDRAFANLGLVCGQVLLAPLDFGVRQQYLHARATIRRLLDLAVVPVVNENDAIADDEIRFGDNDRLAALVAHLVDAEVLVLLTDAPGLLTADPRLDPSASLIEEIMEVDHSLEALVGGAGTAGKRRDGVEGGGGAYGRVVGVRVVIAGADRPGVLQAAIAGEPGAGTTVQPRDRRLPARKLWIAFAVGASGMIVVDDGAVTALREGGKSLLPAGVRYVQGRFDADAAVEVAGPDGKVFAKGMVRLASDLLMAVAGKRTGDLPDGVPHEVIHRDDLVVLPD